MALVPPFPAGLIKVLDLDNGCWEGSNDPRPLYTNLKCEEAWNLDLGIKGVVQTDTPFSPQPWQGIAIKRNGCWLPLSRWTLYVTEIDYDGPMPRPPDVGAPINLYIVSSFREGSTFPTDATFQQATTPSIPWETSGLFAQFHGVLGTVLLIYLSTDPPPLGTKIRIGMRVMLDRVSGPPDARLTTYL